MELHSNRGEFIVDKEHVLLAVVVSGMVGSQLIHVVVVAMHILEVGRYCNQVNASLHHPRFAFIVLLRLYLKSI